MKLLSFLTILLLSFSGHPDTLPEKKGQNKPESYVKGEDKPLVVSPLPNAKPPFPHPKEIPNAKKPYPTPSPLPTPEKGDMDHPVHIAQSNHENTSNSLKDR
ncbi:hypothetical protein [Alkalihalobacillus sp. AL-G]|uniref:hypothetical protein n=1 Tax=Alkalihalobacillus sp. AL-G TaxID=2926399 RepID=UPI00272BE371|nr:hypothetical protein [Alkalihalobacillus sp. AL-G]WLD92754.1 hypothetical protein MOJ78_17350 [Alkalihalobacillus sp. AL-G]